MADEEPAVNEEAVADYVPAVDEEPVAAEEPGVVVFLWKIRYSSRAQLTGSGSALSFLSCQAR